MTLQIKWPASLQGKGKLAEIEKLKPSILMEGGKALQELLGRWMEQLNATRSKHGSGHFTSDKVQDPVVNGDYVFVSIDIPGIKRALHDIVIRPVEAQSLAIPLHESAYGISPRNYNLDHPKGNKDALFRPKGKDYLARRDDSGDIVVMYLLKKEVHQAQDRSLLPPADEMVNTTMDAIRDAVEAVLQG
jgi:hypothetical protein